MSNMLVVWANFLAVKCLPNARSSDRKLDSAGIPIEGNPEVKSLQGQGIAKILIIKLSGSHKLKGKEDVIMSKCQPSRFVSVSI